ncbi:hypothetical protein, partial [Klebsiella variicola]|uniref:hypothetical protein n=1 Tax=Klebsiella variicola TaxID=244366 RepID=UPI001C5937B5
KKNNSVLSVASPLPILWIKNFYRSLQNRITPDFRWIDNVFSGGMMRSRSEHSSRFFTHDHLHPASANAALWPAFIDPGDSGAEYARPALARP